MCYARALWRACAIVPGVVVTCLSFGFAFSLALIPLGHVSGLRGSSVQCMGLSHVLLLCMGLVLIVLSVLRAPLSFTLSIRPCFCVAYLVT